MKNIAQNILFGVVTGDALGVPREFFTREELRKNPLNDMIGYGTYKQEPGTWSDDGSMTLILAEVLSTELSKEKVIEGFIRRYKENYWTARGVMFDIGNQTQKAIEGLINNVTVDISSEYQNGNGSLMRILPLILVTKDFKIPKERFELIKEISGITHGNIRSVIACYYYLEFARYIILGEDIFTIYKKLQKEIPLFLENEGISEKEIDKFWRLFILDIYKLGASPVTG